MGVRACQAAAHFLLRHPRASPAAAPALLGPHPVGAWMVAFTRQAPTLRSPFSLFPGARNKAKAAVPHPQESRDNPLPSIPMSDRTQIQARTSPPLIIQCHTILRPLFSRTIAALSPVLPYASCRSLTGLDPRTPALKCQPDGTRPSWPQALLRFPLKISPKQGLASGPYALRSRKGTAGMGSALK